MSFELTFLLILCLVFDTSNSLRTPLKVNQNQFSSGRPSYERRTFHSKYIDDLIDSITSRMKDKQLAAIFENCFPNTLDTTVRKCVENDTFIITGDIEAMWLRDAFYQTFVYIQFINKDVELKKLIRGLIRKETELILIDPYANAFNFENSISGHHSEDISYKKGFLNSNVDGYNMKIFERKFEIDSLVAFIKLCNAYYEYSKDLGFFQEDYVNWISTVKLIITIFKQFQDENDEYIFWRQTTNPLDSLIEGRGPPFRKTGMVASPFRPSDDSTTFAFQISVNADLYVSLTRLCDGILRDLGEPDLIQEIEKLTAEVKTGIEEFGTFQHKEFGEIYAFEVNGFHSMEVADMASIPSLLSLPFIGFCESTDRIYQNTRAFALSSSNPYYFLIENEIDDFGGVGDSHTGRNKIWPMGIMIRILTSSNDNEILKCLDILKKSATNGFMHESFSNTSYQDYTRAWFAWSNSLFGEVILYLAANKPHLIF